MGLAHDGPPSFVVDALREHGKQPKLLTLVLVHQDGRLLLGEKLRGFGKGYFNGFGGKVEAGETIEQAAHRELTEEACITASDMSLAGVLTFVFDDNPQPWEVHVFRVGTFAGEPTETDEMRPQWFPEDQPPFERMWADDPHWYPLFLAPGGGLFQGVFGFTQTTALVWHTLHTGLACGKSGKGGGGACGGSATWREKLVPM